MVDLSQFGNLADMTAYYISEERCRDAIIESRWGSGDEQDVVCPYCGGHHCRRHKGGKFRCPQCKCDFSCLSHTIFKNTKLPLRKWFIAIYHMSSNKNGISSCQLAREIGITQKSAFYMLKKIRSLYAQKPDKKCQAPWNATRCISAARKSGNTSQSERGRLKAAQRRPKRPFSA